MAYRRVAVQSHRDEWRAEFSANSRPSTRRVPPQPPLSMQFQVRIAGPDVGRRVWPGGMGARDQAGNNAIDAAQMIEQKELPTTTGPDERHAGARRSKDEAVVRHDQRELVGIVEDLQC